jgi:hypothetical protein
MQKAYLMALDPIIPPNTTELTDAMSCPTSSLLLTRYPLYPYIPPNNKPAAKEGLEPFLMKPIRPPNDATTAFSNEKLNEQKRSKLYHCKIRMGTSSRCHINV